MNSICLSTDHVAAALSVLGLDVAKASVQAELRSSGNKVRYLAHQDRIYKPPSIFRFTSDPRSTLVVGDDVMTMRPRARNERSIGPHHGRNAS